MFNTLDSKEPHELFFEVITTTEGFWMADSPLAFEQWLLICEKNIDKYEVFLIQTQMVLINSSF